MCGGAGKVSIPEIRQQGEGWGEASETNTCKCRVRSALSLFQTLKFCSLWIFLH